MRYSFGKLDNVIVLFINIESFVLYLGKIVLDICDLYYIGNYVKIYKILENVFMEFWLKFLIFIVVRWGKREYFKRFFDFGFDLNEVLCDIN